MRLEPPNLNVPLEKAERRVLPLLLTGFLLCALAVWLDARWGIGLSAAYLAGLPVLYLFLRPKLAQKCLKGKGQARVITCYLVIFGYLALAKQFLVPGLIALINALFQS